MDTLTFEKQAKTQGLQKSVYVFAGPEAFLKEKAFALVAKSYVPPEEQSENVTRKVCTGKDLPEYINLIFSFSFNPSARLFFLQDIDEVTAKQRKDFLDKLKNGGLPPETYLFFTTKDSKVATEITSAFKQIAEKIDFWAPFANKLGDWIRQETVELGSEITIDAADQLIELAGSDLALLHQELTKLVLAKPGSKITLTDVTKSVAYVKQDTPFDFLDAFGKRIPSKAVRILEALNNRGEPATKLWYMLCKQIREYRLFHAFCADRPDLMEPILVQLRKYRLYADKSDFKSNQEKKNILGEIQNIADELPEAISNYLGLKYSNKVKSLYMALNFTLPELISMWPAIINTDKKLKSGVPDANAALQLFVSDILCK